MLAEHIWYLALGTATTCGTRSTTAGSFEVSIAVLSRDETFLSQETKKITAYVIAFYILSIIADDPCSSPGFTPTEIHTINTPWAADSL